MSTTKETVKVCDICAKRVSDNGEMYVGGHPHAGWFHIEKHGGPTTLEAIRAKREWDVCGIKCLKTLASKAKP